MISNIKRKIASSSSSFSSSRSDRQQKRSSNTRHQQSSSPRTHQHQDQNQAQNHSEQNSYHLRHRNSSATNWSITSTLLNEECSCQPLSRSSRENHNNLDPNSYEAFLQNALDQEHQRERNERAVRRANNAWEQGFRRPEVSGARNWLQGCGLAK